MPARQYLYINHTNFFTPKFNFMYKFTQRILSLLFFMLTFSAVSIAQSNTFCNGVTYKQNFDGIGNSATATLPAGWKVDVNSGNTQVGAYSTASTSTDHRAGADMNNANGSGIYNFGAGTTPQGNGDRAIGGVTGSTSDKSVNIYLDLQNTCASTITDVVVSYAIEKYRNGSNPDGYSVKLYYSTTGLAGSWTLAPTFTQNYSPDATDNGFNPAPDASQTRYVNGSLSGLSLATNAHLYLAWNISTTTTVGGSAPNKSMALAIDDIKISGGAAGFAPALYFRSVASGDWATPATWQSSSDNVNWSVAGAAGRGPNYNDYTISVQSPNIVTVSGAQTADQLVVNGTIAITGSLSIYDGTGFDITVNTGGSVTSSGTGNLILKSYDGGSSDVGTASVGPVTGTITATTVVERFISAMYPRSAWRMLAAPITSIASIYDTWQNGGNNTSGIGTTVTGPGADPTTNGLDYVTPQYSMKWWNGTSFTTVSNTKTTPVANNSGYFIFIRGDRSVGVGSAGQTTLSSTGLLKTGNITVNTSSTNDAFTMVGNPYASPVDLLTFSQDNSGSNTQSNYYYWDPYLTGVWGVGGFVTVSIDNQNNVTITPEAGAQGDETRFLQSGQAMYVQTRSVGNGGANSVVFNENQKSYNTANYIFRTMSNQVEKLSVNLNVLAAGTPVLVDGIVAAFNSNYSAALDNYDAAKMFNIGESISFIRNNINLSVERRPGITSDDIFNLNLTSLQPATTYQIEIKSTFSNIGLNAFLVDNYLKTSTPLDLSKTNTVNFTVNSDAASTGANRFYISFAKPVVTVAAGKDGISVFPNPVTNGTINIQMNNMPAGLYNVRVVNGMGQVMVSRQINHVAGNSTETIQLGKGAGKGIYQLEVIKPDNNKFATKVMAN